MTKERYRTSELRSVDFRDFVFDKAAVGPPSTLSPPLTSFLPLTPSPQTPHTHREHTTQAPMFEPLMQALDTTNGRTRRRYVNATWTQHGRWLQTRASPFISFSTPSFPFPPLPHRSPLPSLCLLFPPPFFFLLDAENAHALLNYKERTEQNEP